MKVRTILAIACGLGALVLTVWAVVLLVIMVAHAVSTFVTALVMLMVAAVLGWAVMALISRNAIESITKRFFS